MPQGSVPSCAGKSYSGQFFKPLTADVYRPGDTIETIWHSGPPDSEGRTVSQSIHLTLYYATDAGQINTGTTSLNIFRDGFFVFTADRDNTKYQWTNKDVCGNSEMFYNWTIPTNFAISPNGKHILVAFNASTNNNFLATSGVFLIQPAQAQSSSSFPATSTTSTPLMPLSPGGNGNIPPSPSNPTTPLPQSDGLSTAAKAGIGAGVPILAILLVLLAWAFWRRRRRMAQPEPARPVSAGFDKAELDGKVQPKPQTADVGDVHEMGGHTDDRGDLEPYREPVELHGSEYQRPKG